MHAAFDVLKNPRAPEIAHVVEPETIKEKTGLSWPHTSHCLGTGEVVISHLGDVNGDGKGGFVVFDQDFKIKGTWGDQLTEYGYDFWCVAGTLKFATSHPLSFIMLLIPFDDDLRCYCRYSSEMSPVGTSLATTC